MSGEEQKLEMAAKMIEQAREALRKPGAPRNNKLVNTAVTNALFVATSAMEKAGELAERIESLADEMAGKLSKEEGQQMYEHHASETQKAQRQAEQKMQRSVKALESKIKTLKAQVERGTKRAAPGSAAPKPKRERHEYDPSKYTLKGADGQQKTMAAAVFADMEDLLLLIKAAKEEPGRIKGNPTLNPSNLKAWRITVDPERLPFNATSGRHIYLSAFLEEGKEKAAQAKMAEGEVEAVAI